MTADEICQRLRAERKRRGLTLRQVAQEMAGPHTFQQVGQWELGVKLPNLKNFVVWAAALGLELSLAPTSAPPVGAPVLSGSAVPPGG